MNGSEAETNNESTSPGTFVEGTDFYFDDGFMVLTAGYLRRRGYCCSNGCRHCPYTDEERTAATSSK
jgi:hypothetical protein